MPAPLMASAGYDLPGRSVRLLVRVLAVLFDDSIEKLSCLPRTDCLDGNRGDGSEQFCNFLGISNFGVVVFGVGVDQSEHNNAPPR